MKNFERLVIGMMLTFPTFDAQAAILGQRADNGGDTVAAAAVKAPDETSMRPGLDQLADRFVTVRRQGSSGFTVASRRTNATSADEYKKRARAAEGACAAWAQFAAIAAAKIEDPLVSRFSTQMAGRRIVERGDVEAVMPQFLARLDEVIAAANGGAAVESSEIVEARERIASLELDVADRDTKLASAAGVVRKLEQEKAAKEAELEALRAAIASMEDIYATALAVVHTVRTEEKSARVEALEASAARDEALIRLHGVEHQTKAALAAGPARSPAPRGYVDLQRNKVAATLMSPDKGISIAKLRENAERARAAAQALAAQELTPPHEHITRRSHSQGARVTTGESSAVTSKLDLAAGAATDGAGAATVRKK